MSQEESEKLLAILRRTLSGTLGKKPGGHHLLHPAGGGQQRSTGSSWPLQGSSLADEEAVQALFSGSSPPSPWRGTISSSWPTTPMTSPTGPKTGERMDDASDQVFSYILCSICPVKLTKPALSYFVYENAFHDLKADWVVSAGGRLPLPRL